MKVSTFFLRCVVAFALVVLSVPAYAEIEWLATEYNFGAFREAEGPQTGKVQFVNKGPGSTFVSRVRPSCGCTGASYSEEMIAPGDTATVTFTYDPTGRPGRFNKSVKVYVGEDNKLYTIRMVGTVIGAPTSLDSSFPVAVGPLRFENLMVPAGEIKRGSARHVFLNVYNQSSDSVSPGWVNDNPAVEIDLKPAVIPPGELATFSFYIRGSEEEQNGPLEHQVRILSDKGNPEAGTADVTIGCIIVADMDKLSVEEIEKGPRAYVIPEFVDFGEIESGRLLEFGFNVLNDGKSPLIVERVYCGNELVNIVKMPGKIKPGKRGEVKGKLNPSGLPDGAFRIKIEVLTNDPLHPVRTVNLVGIKETSK